MAILFSEVAPNDNTAMNDASRVVISRCGALLLLPRNSEDAA